MSAAAAGSADTAEQQMSCVHVTRLCRALTVKNMSLKAGSSLKKTYSMFHVSSLLLYTELVGGLKFHLCF